jgi:methylated-DNA-[protein]-cysteine S-methyltransferase
LTFGHPSAATATRRLDEISAMTERAGRVPVEWQRSLQRFAAGEPIDLRALPVDLCALTDFQRRVLQACRRIPYGRTSTYFRLARQAGSPQAARAVGQVMARNPVPLMIPCHRVLGSGGKLGGFSAPSGLAMKKRLLAMEATPRAMAGAEQIGWPDSGGPEQ